MLLLFQSRCEKLAYCRFCLESSGGQCGRGLLLLCLLFNLFICLSQTANEKMDAFFLFRSIYYSLKRIFRNRSKLKRQFSFKRAHPYVVGYVVRTCRSSQVHRKCTVSRSVDIQTEVDGSDGVAFHLALLMALVVTY